MSYPTTPAAQNNKAVIISHGLVAARDPNRTGQLDFIVRYQVGPNHQFTVIVPKEHPTPAEVDIAIQQDYTKQKQFINREVNIT